MPFPQSERVVYERNPLVEVICQLQFPAILKIDATPPVDFQEAIRATFPEYREVSNSPMLPANVPKEIAEAFLASRPGRALRHDFLTSNGDWCVTLAANFLALKTTCYKHRAEFQEMLGKPLAALTEIYKPAYLDRIGLRYVDFIVPAKLGIEGQNWPTLVNTMLSGVLSDSTLSADAVNYSGEAQLKLPDSEGLVTLRYGLANNSETEERGFLIDSDFFTSETNDLDATTKILQSFHNHAGRLFRWAISDVLHEALGPKPS